MAFRIKNENNLITCITLLSKSIDCMKNLKHKFLPEPILDQWKEHLGFNKYGAVNSEKNRPSLKYGFDASEVDKKNLRHTNSEISQMERDVTKLFET